MQFLKDIVKDHTLVCKLAEIFTKNSINTHHLVSNLLFQCIHRCLQGTKKVIFIIIVGFSFKKGFELAQTRPSRQIDYLRHSYQISDVRASTYVVGELKVSAPGIHRLNGDLHCGCSLLLFARKRQTKKCLQQLHEENRKGDP